MSCYRHRPTALSLLALVIGGYAQQAHSLESVSERTSGTSYVVSSVTTVPGQIKRVPSTDSGPVISSPVRAAVSRQTTPENPPAASDASRSTTASHKGLDFSLLGAKPLDSVAALCPHSAAQVCFAGPVNRIYDINGYMPLWNTKALRDALFLRLTALGYAGLAPGIEQRVKELKEREHDNDQRGFDILATDSYLVYQAFIRQLKAQPSRLFRHQSLLPIERSALTTLPVSVITSGINESTLLNELQGRPTLTEQMSRVVRMAEKYQRLPAHHYTPKGRVLVKKGQVIPLGHEMLDVLVAYGDMSSEVADHYRASRQILNDGEVNQAIRRFQHRNGMADDGVIGPATAKQLALPYSEVARVLALNLHRSQLVASGENRPSIRINIPDYRMEIAYHDQIVFESKVIVGRNSRPTNLFSSALNVMVVNPNWNVPETIKKKDVIPKAKASTDYLRKKDLKIIRSWRDRSEISPDQIEWASVTPETFPYEFMQGPGPTNSLGNVKFLMPNDYAIYLHDTPARGLFNRSKRNLSSGCVRVEKAADLARFIIDYQQRPSWRSYDKLVAGSSTDTISLPRRIDVDMTYLTAWVDDNDQLQMREDIYGYDRPTDEPADPVFSTMKNYRYTQ
ncbi:L,D-transpeptidase family protein [Photobacterium sp. GSS17]|uniref:L,D-transpeptidase family protein n=1 Tax=Photobacterium sp. GSS17 TaxID=3020715 RepID=UPI0023618ED1|nr:L,D-transpeptidase family protein [Photobacterium sp. GSS17]